MKTTNGKILSNIRISVSLKLLVFFFSASPCGYYFIGQTVWVSITLPPVTVLLRALIVRSEIYIIQHTIKILTTKFAAKSNDKQSHQCRSKNSLGRRQPSHTCYWFEISIAQSCKSNNAKIQSISKTAIRLIL